MNRIKTPLVTLILLAGLLTVALLIGSLGAPIAAAQEGCTWHCFDGTTYRDDYACGYDPLNCSFCDLVCPAILQPST